MALGTGLPSDDKDSFAMDVDEDNTPEPEMAVTTPSATEENPDETIEVGPLLPYPFLSDHVPSSLYEFGPSLSLADFPKRPVAPSLGASASGPPTSFEAAKAARIKMEAAKVKREESASMHKKEEPAEIKEEPANKVLLVKQEPAETKKAAPQPRARATEILVSVSYGKKHCRGIAVHGATPDGEPFEALGPRCRTFYCHVFNYKNSKTEELVDVAELAAGRVEFWAKVAELVAEHWTAGHRYSDLKIDAEVDLVWPDGSRVGIPDDRALEKQMPVLEAEGWHVRLEIVYCLVSSWPW